MLLIATHILLAAMTCVVAIPVLVFTVEVFLSLLPKRRGLIPASQPGGASSPRIVVLIPAHNEQLTIGRTVQRLIPTLPHNASVLVVADNCTDSTAQVAADAGAKVIARENRVQRGKGYALDFGLRFLDANPPDVVYFLDADCEVDTRTVWRLSEAAFVSQRPVQGLNTCLPAKEDGPGQVLSALGMRFRNQVRTTGLLNAGMPCHLFGTGMAFPWSLIKDAPLASGNLVEDLKLGIDLAVRGTPPMFIPDVEVTSPMPAQSSAVATQKTRWVQGHLRTIKNEAPRLMWRALTLRRIDLACLALDLCVPPLSLMCMLWLICWMVAAAAAVVGASLIPVITLSVVGLLAGLAGFSGWYKFCRRTAPLSRLACIPLYIAGNLPIYTRFALRKAEKGWVRTARDADRGNSPVTAA
jgi:cellulose synthase/poly-beta-1,6-N-acetylglucosamine synthase-like glycosyltransferase